jgi:hypothetical protein
MTASYWGTPILTSDPYQDAGNYYAVSRSGWEGPYEAPADEHLTTAMTQVRMGATRTVQGPDGEHYYYGWLMLRPTGDDVPSRRKHVLVVPPPRRVRFTGDGAMQLVWHEGLERFTHRVDLPAPQFKSPDFATRDGIVTGKKFDGSAIAMFTGNYSDVIFFARIRFLRGDRAGLVVRMDEAGQAGWQAIVDRRRRRVEFGIAGREGFIDARAWQPADEVVLKVVANQESVEVYLEDRLMIHQVRHRETAGQIGYVVDAAEAVFCDAQLRVFGEGGPT